MVKKLTTIGGGEEAFDDLEDRVNYERDLFDVKSFHFSTDVSDVMENPKLGGHELFLNMFEGTGFVDECEVGKPLGDVLEFFGGMVDEMGLQEALFFKNDEVKMDFVERLRVFVEITQDEIAGLERKLKIHEKTCFSEGWQDRLMKAACYAFFVHYGAKRKLEVDANGEPKDYVNHVARSTFNCLIRKMMFFDEETVLATMLHDTREDWSKSFISILHMSEKDGFTDEDLQKAILGGVKGTELHKEMLELEKAAQVILYMKRMEKVLNPSVEGSNLSKLIEMVTKKYSDRNRTLLDLLHELSCIDYEDPKFYHEWKALMIKIADRLDNARTVIIDPNKDLSVTLKQIRDETAQFYRVKVRQGGMRNVEDWYIDYLYKQHLIERGITRGVDYTVEKQTGMKLRFRQDFQRELEAKCPEASLGVNYWIEFRPVGIRHLDFENLSLSEDDYHAYSQKLRSYMIFFPIGDPPDGLIDEAKKVFSDIFSETMSMPVRCDEDNPLEELISKRIDSGKAGCGLDEYAGYGAGVWMVFDSQREAAECLLGDFHLAYFYGDKEAINRIMQRFKGISANIEKLENFYDFVVLDLLERVKKEPKLQSSLDFLMDEFSKWVKSILGETGGI